MATRKEIDNALRSLPYGRENAPEYEQSAFLNDTPDLMLEYVEISKPIIEKLLKGGYETLIDLVNDFYPQLPRIEIVDDDELDEEDE